MGGQCSGATFRLRSSSICAQLHLKKKALDFLLDMLGSCQAMWCQALNLGLLHTSMYLPFKLSLQPPPRNLKIKLSQVLLKHNEKEK